MNHLEVMGGPFYELSFLLIKNAGPAAYLNKILKEFESLSTFKISDSKKIDKIANFVQGYDNGDGQWFRSIDLTCEIRCAGSRECRLFITELSKSVILCDMWFFGSKESSFNYRDDGIHDKEKPAFRVLLTSLIRLLNPRAATIGYEVDCQELFCSTNTYPHSDYEIQNIMNKEELIEVVPNMAFEYCYLSQYNSGATNNLQVILDRIL